MEIKNDAVKKTLEVKTDLSAVDLAKAAVELPTLGRAGKMALDTMRAIAAAAANMENAVATLRITLDGVQDPKARVQAKIFLEAVPQANNSLPLDTPIAQLKGQLSAGVYSRLTKPHARIAIVRDLLEKTRDDLLQIRKIGDRGVQEVREWLAKYDLKLRGRLDIRFSAACVVVS